jgi:hypothetical protein
MTAFYGAGAPYVKEYFNKCNELLKHPSKEDALGDTDAYPMSTGIYGENLPQLSEEFLDEAIELWRKAAEAVKGDNEREINVATGALAPYYIRLKRRYEKDFKSVGLTDEPEKFAVKMRALKPLAADFVSRLDALRKHKRGVSLSEGYKRSQKMCADFKALSIKSIEPKSADKVFISTNVLARVHGAWQFPLREIACDEGVKYRLRVKARLKRGSTSSAGFSAGLNVPWLPHAPGQFKREISDLNEEWQWREVGGFDFAALQKHRDRTNERDHECHRERCRDQKHANRSARDGRFSACLPFHCLTKKAIVNAAKLSEEIFCFFLLHSVHHRSSSFSKIVFNCSRMR